MIALVQRAGHCSVKVDGKTVGEIEKGITVFVGVFAEDSEKECDYLAKKIANLRIFCDVNDKMNRSLLDVGGQILAVSQFTLLGDARSSRRPSFTQAARPETANPMYERLVAAWREQGIHVETGRFGADMKVALVNDGPVTIMMDSHKLF